MLKDMALNKQSWFYSCSWGKIDLITVSGAEMASSAVIYEFVDIIVK